MDNKVTCSKCGSDSGQLSYQPIQTYEAHIEVIFFEHPDMESKAQVPMCRKCAKEIALGHLSKAGEELEFWA